jgi:hypothetical protein
VYLTADVPADSFTARTLNASHALGAGYHLVGIRKPTDDVRATRRACNRRAQQMALDRENARRGTDYSYDEVLNYACQDEIDDCNREGSLCEPPPPTVPSRLCDRPEEELDEFLDAIDGDELEFKLRLGCRLGDWVMTYIEDPSQERIKVELTPSRNPLSPFIHEPAVTTTAPSAGAAGATPSEAPAP